MWKASQAWNTIYKYILNHEKGLATSVNLIKIRSKAIIFECQALHEIDEWKPDNFSLNPKATNFTYYTHNSSCIPQNDHHNIDIQ